MVLVTPPPVLGELPGRGCVSMHNCRYWRSHPTRACTALVECVSCGKGDLVDAPFCVRANMLPTIRRVVGALGEELRGVSRGTHRRGSQGMPFRMPRMPPPPMAPAMPRLLSGTQVEPLVTAAPSPRSSSSRCPADTVSMLSGTQLIPANSEMFTGPVHLNAKASALIACSVFEVLSRHCVRHGNDTIGHIDSTNCEFPAYGALSKGNDTTRQRSFCDVLQSSLRKMHQSEFVPDAHWNTLQGTLHNWVGLHG